MSHGSYGPVKSVFFTKALAEFQHVNSVMLRLNRNLYTESCSFLGCFNGSYSLGTLSHVVIEA